MVGLLASAQFIMVLDTTVMNVSISQVVADLNTTVVGLQTAITLYTLVMASLMLIGGKFGERWGAKRTFAVGLARLRDRVVHHGDLTEPGRAAGRVVADRGPGRRPGDPGHRRPDGRHLHRQATRGGLRHPRRGERRVHGRRPADRRLGLGPVLLALRLRRRVRRRPGHPGLPADRPRHQGPPDQARHHRRRAVRPRAGVDRARRPALQPVGLDHPERRRPAGQRATR